ncbi:hypothetical protein Z945_3573 [Sulfitobacter noctilucae]|uniref:hypothetical protein n=1 Tax=Sulfitobacter noctilucae TaxID=1342302 RepID=UPI000469A1BD|nr:hypothetical protein [Sulfitobacter noctilucae]KIN70518.1 hypothetical protein Z945_3573 [Sulfitobacter noctilucae]
MNAVTLIEQADGTVICDIVAAPTHEDCHSLCRYLEKYWQAEIKELHDTGFAAKFEVVLPGRTVFLSHDSQTGNALSAPSGPVDKIIPEIIADLRERLSS